MRNLPAGAVSDELGALCGISQCFLGGNGYWGVWYLGRYEEGLAAPHHEMMDSVSQEVVYPPRKGLSIVSGVVKVCL